MCVNPANCGGHCPECEHQRATNETGRLIDKYGSARARGGVVGCQKERAELLTHIAEKDARVSSLETSIGVMVAWLEENQPDVFRRGLWDALRESKEGAWPL